MTCHGFVLFFYFENLIPLPSSSHNTRIVLTVLEIVFFVQIWTSECKQCLHLIASSIFAGLETLLIKGVGILHSLLLREDWQVKPKAERLEAGEVAAVLEYRPGTENRSWSSSALPQTSSYTIISDKVIFISLCPSSLTVKW